MRWRSKPWIEHSANAGARFFVNVLRWSFTRDGRRSIASRWCGVQRGYWPVWAATMLASS